MFVDCASIEKRMGVDILVPWIIVEDNCLREVRYLLFGGS